MHRLFLFLRVLGALGNLTASLNPRFRLYAIHPGFEVIETVDIHPRPVVTAHPRLVGDVGDAVFAREIVTIAKLIIEHLVQTSGFIAVPAEVAAKASQSALGCGFN